MDPHMGFSGGTSQYLESLPLSFGLVLLVSYLIGSIPFGLILSKLSGYGDIRKIGSGNIGATNVLRTGNKTLAFATLFLDVAKAIACVVVSINFLIDEKSFLDLHPIATFAGFAAVVGHCYPVWLQFKGGKGVATALGALLAAVPLAGVVACVTWGITAGFFRISSLSALVSVAVVPIVAYLIYGAAPAVVTILIALLVFWRHKENIQRLLKGEEPKIGAKK